MEILTPDIISARLGQWTSANVIHVAVKPWSRDDRTHTYFVHIRDQSPNITATFAKHYPDAAADGWNNLVITPDSSARHGDTWLRFIE
jgi:hypothetical protein